MKKKDWISDDIAYAPGPYERVWIAHTAPDMNDKVIISEGYFDRYYVVWRFNNGDRVSSLGGHVVGWLPIDRPTYDFD